MIKGKVWIRNNNPENSKNNFRLEGEYTLVHMTPEALKITNEAWLKILLIFIKKG